MSTDPLKGWKARAFESLAEYYKLLEEKASWEERIEASQRKCERSGVRFRYGGPEVPSSNLAFLCPCGSVVAEDYDVMKLRQANPDVVVHCDDCREKSRTAAREDAALEGRVAVPETKTPPPEEIPF